MSEQKRRLTKEEREKIREYASVAVAYDVSWDDVPYLLDSHDAADAEIERLTKENERLRSLYLRLIDLFYQHRQLE